MKVAEISFTWLPQGPLLSGYGYGFSREAELIERGEKKVVQYESRNAQGERTPSFLATAAKGVFRSAAAWLVEREGQIQHKGRDRDRVYITSDYVHARPVKGGWQKAIGKLKREDEYYFGLDPVARIFGDTGGIPQKSSNAMRRQGLVRFSFDMADLTDSDALFGTVQPGGQQIFAWEAASDRQPTPLLTEKFTPQSLARLKVRLQSGEQQNQDAEYRLGIALICLSADLISTGFFRFGRFTSRGYGWVRLVDPNAKQTDLKALLLSDPTSTNNELLTGAHGAELARKIVGEDPRLILKREVQQWISGV